MNEKREQTARGRVLGGFGCVFDLINLHLFLFFFTTFSWELVLSDDLSDICTWRMLLTYIYVQLHS